ncbi:MAG: triose-phosphate isomerase [Gammaproteobacteria bacterium]|jgi:triosephosphate isomerase
MAKRLVIANWKMNGDLTLVNETIESLQAEPNVDVVVVPPVVYLAALSNAPSAAFLTGLQNVSQFASGAHTGEVAAAMGAEVGATWALVGHSERRAEHGEGDDMVSAKGEQALRAGLSVVICVGESLAVREAGKAEAFVSEQVRAQAACLSGSGTVAIAYEPIWAIGSGVSASSEQAVAMHKVIRQTVRDVAPEQADAVRILYGGSVNSENAADLFAHPEVEGVLVGGASLDKAQFAAIIRAASAAAP